MTVSGVSRRKGFQSPAIAAAVIDARTLLAKHKKVLDG